MATRGKFIISYMPVQYYSSLVPLVVLGNYQRGLDNSQQELDSCQQVLPDRLVLVLGMGNQDKPILHVLTAAT